ncbi:unnamed protein product [Eruca vesicaria subsp. sativa]|uniref:J domain-containing protein n=1 Tax=Eruca vesicaria subsp. sativa TaxID=29727 RepID=A0ABC8KU28_ERUVS|nr:unnamed protein product [Eruca vesicaria subsp. sativa]
MIAAVRAAFLKPQGYSSNVKTVFLFHSTPILQRKHKSNSETRNKKLSRSRAKQDLRRNVNAFAEHLFGIWSDGFDYSEKPTTWFEKQYFRVCKRNRIGRYIHQRLDKSCFDFSGVDDDCEIEYFLRSALGGSYKERKSRWRARHFYGSNTHEDDGEAGSWRFSNKSSGRSWDSRQRLDQEEQKEEEHSSTDFSNIDSSEQSHRHTLGLSSSGPLSLEDVKNAYRVCALKWHPDHHDDSTKDAAEEKFKLCNLAYQSLCEKFAMN